MKSRVITGAAGIAAVALIIYLGKYSMLSALIIIQCIAAAEYYTLIYQKKSLPDLFFHFAAGSSLMLCAAFRFDLILPLMSCLIILIFAKDILAGRNDAMTVIFSAWGLIHISLFLSLGVRILFLNGGLAMISIVLVSTFVCDIAAYFGGFLFGKHKLCPEISPKKTVEGAVFGFVFSAAAFSLGYLLNGFIDFADLSFFSYLAGGIAVSVFSQFGDLAASLIKRKFSAKDFSSILPGHGGFLDRIDSILFSFASVYALFSFLGYF